MRKLVKKYLIASCLLLSACSHIPAAVENAPRQDISYAQAIQNMAYYKDFTIRWGGIILAVENYQYESFIHVLMYPLDSDGRPDLDQDSVGRFMIKTPNFIDPIVYKINAKITTFGTLNSIIERTTDRRILKLPVILAEIIYLWPKPNSGSYPFVVYGGGGWPKPYPPIVHPPHPCKHGFNHHGQGHHDCPPPPPCDKRVYESEQRYGHSHSNDDCPRPPPPPPPPPPPECKLGEMPDGIGGCKPKRTHCEGDERHDDAGNCIKILTNASDCRLNEVVDAFGVCQPKPDPPRDKCEGNEVPDGNGGCTVITTMPKPEIIPAPPRHRCEDGEIAVGSGECRQQPQPPTIIPETIDTSDELRRGHQEEERQKQIAAQQEADEQRGRERERDLAVQQQQELAQQKQAEAAAAQQEADEQRRQEHDAAAAQQKQEQAAAAQQEAEEQRGRDLAVQQQQEVAQQKQAEAEEKKKQSAHPRQREE